MAMCVRRRRRFCPTSAKAASPSNESGLRFKVGALPSSEGEAYWQEVLMRGLDNDRWRGEVPLGDNGRYYFTIIAWRDLFSSWQDEISKKHSAGLAVDLELEEGRMIIEKALQGEPRGGDPGDLQALRLMLERHADDPDGTSKLEWLTSRETGDLMARVGPRTSFTRYDRELEVWVDRRCFRAPSRETPGGTAPSPT